MGWTGKIVGGVLGLALGPFGAALGVALGHQYDLKQGKRPNADQGLPLDQRFYRTTFRVMGHVAKADGRVTEREIAAARGFMDSLRLGEPQRLAAIRLFGIGKSPGYDLADDLRQLRTACADAPELLRVFLEIQIRVALAGNDMAGAVRLRLGQVALQLGCPAAQFVRLEASLRSGARQGAGPAGANHEARLAEAYRLLELEREASDEDVTRAYRRQMSRHHPDKLKANGLPDSMLEHAKERTQQVREAYELLREHRGLG
jgi:DnaJ like chaperone protein